MSTSFETVRAPAFSVAVSVAVWSGWLKIWSCAVLYESQTAHLRPSQWYLTSVFAQQSLQYTHAFVSRNCGGMGWLSMALSRCRKVISMFVILLLQIGHL